MKSIRPIHLALVLSASFAFACDVVKDPTLPTGATLTITAPSGEPNRKDKIGGTTIPVSFAVSKFTLAPKGTCNGNQGCGHVLAFVDGPSCGSGPQVTTAETSLVLDASKCTDTYFGTHEVLLQLVKDDGTTPVVDSSGGVVSARAAKFKEQATYVSAQKILAAKCAPCHTTEGGGGHNIATKFADVGKDVAGEYKDCITKDKDGKITARKKVGECAVVRIKDGTMPLGKNCKDAPSGPGCLTKAELNVIENWVSTGALEN